MKDDTSVQAEDRSLGDAMTALRDYFSAEKKRALLEGEALKTINPEWAKKQHALRMRLSFFSRLASDILTDPDKAAEELKYRTAITTKKIEETSLYLKLRAKIESAFLGPKEPSSDPQ